MKNEDRLPRGYVPYESVAEALLGMAISKPERASNKASDTIESINDVALKQRMRWRADPAKMLTYHDQVKSEEMQVPELDPKRVVAHFNGDFENPGPAVPRAEPQDAPQPEEEVIRECQAKEELDADLVEQLSAESVIQYREITALVMEGDSERLLARLLNNGRPLPLERFAHAEASEEFKSGMRHRQEWLQRLQELMSEPTCVGSEREAVLTKEGNVLHETITITLELPGADEILALAQRSHPEHRVTFQTAAPDGAPRVLMKRIDGQWYWDPFAVNLRARE